MLTMNYATLLYVYYGNTIHFFNEMWYLQVVVLELYNKNIVMHLWPQGGEVSHIITWV